MREDDIRTPEDLDTALAVNATHRREKLWKAAEGRSPSRTGSVVMIAGALLLIIGTYAAYFTREADALPQIAIGLLLVASAAFRHQQAQIHALRELLQAKQHDDGAARARR